MKFKKAIAMGTLITLTAVSSSSAISIAEQSNVENNMDKNIEVVSEESSSESEDVNNNEEAEMVEEQEVLTLSLSDALEYAFENNKDIEIQEIELQKAEVSYDQNKKALRDSEKAFDLMDSIPGPRTYEVTPDYSVNKALLNNGASKRQVELAYQIAKWNKEIKENEIRYNVEKAYFDLSQMEKELKIAEENLILSQKQHKDGKLMYELGTISEQELLGLEMGLSQAQTAYDATKVGYDMQLMNFQDKLGLSFDTEVKLTDSIEYKEYESIDLQKSIEEALENNAMIKVAKEGYEIADLTLQAIKVRYPEITFRYKEQEAEVAKAEKGLETAKNGVEMGVRSAYSNLLTSEKQIETLQKSVEVAEKMAHLAEVSFELGQGTSSKVMEANINLMNAKKELTSQIHAFNMALLDYEYSIGLGKSQLPSAGM